MIEVRNKNHVVAVNEDGCLLAEAKRYGTKLPIWHIWALVDDSSDLEQVAMLSGCMNEVRLRKAVLVLLKELM